MTNASVDALATKLSALLGEAEDLLRDSGSEKLGEARDALHRACTHLRAAEGEIAQRARAVDRAVRDHPWESLAVTGIVGFLLGYWRRRR